MEKQNSFSLHVGLPTIFLIFISLCFVSFAVLTFVSANADWQLTSKVVARTQQYYDACNQAEEELAVINFQLQELYSQSNSEQAYVDAVATLPNSLSYPISDIQNLNITLSFPYFEEGRDTYYQILSWKVETSETLTYDNHLNVIP